MSDAKQIARPIVSHAADFYAWTREQAERLRSDRPDNLDWANLAEEIEGLGRSEKSEIASRLHILLVHLVKWQAQSGRRKGGWRGTIVEQRARLTRRLNDNPSLGGYPQKVLAAEYKTARIVAADATGLPEKGFPKTCPFTVEQVLDENFWPEGN